VIRHIVLLKARPEVTEATITAIFAGLARIRDKLPGVLAIHSDRSESPEKIERSYPHGFTVDFTDWAALQAYRDHPDHKRVGAAPVAAATGGINGILVFDLPC
jgi:hypothetical protein